MSDSSASIFEQLGIPGSRLRKELTVAVTTINTILVGEDQPALTQVWVPNFQDDGSLGLNCSGAPYAITGADDLLALFRCISCRYTFSPRHADARRRGSVGRVFHTHRPEITNSLETSSKDVYLRVEEATTCGMHSLCVMPLWMADVSRKAPVGVLEIVQPVLQPDFDALMSKVTQALGSIKVSKVSVQAPMPLPLEQLVPRPPLDTSHMEPQGMASQQTSDGQGQLNDHEVILPNDEVDERMSLMGPFQAGHGHTLGMLGGLGTQSTGFTVLPAMTISQNSEAGESLGATSLEQITTLTGTADGPSSSGIHASYGNHADQELFSQTFSHWAGGESNSVHNLHRQSSHPDHGLQPHADRPHIGGSGRGTVRGMNDMAGAMHLLEAVESDTVWQMRARHESVHDGAKYPQTPNFHSKQTGLVHAHTAHNGTIAKAALQSNTSKQSGTDVLSMFMELKRKRHKAEHAQMHVMPDTETLDPPYLRYADASRSPYGLPPTGPLPTMQYAQSHFGTGGEVFHSVRPVQSMSGTATMVPSHQPRPACSSLHDKILRVNGDDAAVSSAPSMLAHHSMAHGSHHTGYMHIPSAMHSTSHQLYHPPVYVTSSRTPPPTAQSEADLAAHASTADPGQNDETGTVNIAADTQGDCEAVVNEDMKAIRNRVNRVDGGVGRKVTLEVLMTQFGRGLKEAAENLGMCPTTLKRACRRLGVKRWPRKLESTAAVLEEVGYVGGGASGGDDDTEGRDKGASSADVTGDEEPNSLCAVSSGRGIGAEAERWIKSKGRFVGVRGKRSGGEHANGSDRMEECEFEDFTNFDDEHLMLNIDELINISSLAPANDLVPESP